MGGGDVITGSFNLITINIRKPFPMIRPAQQHDELSGEGKSFLSPKVLRRGWTVINPRLKRNKG